MTPAEPRNFTDENGSIRLFESEAVGAARGTLLCVHGGPDGDHRGNTNVFDEIADYAPDLGYRVIQFDMYGSGASDGSAGDITLKSEIADYRAVFSYARRSFDGPILVIGESAGATIAALDWSPDVTSYIFLWPAFDLRDTDLRPYLEPQWMTQAELAGFIDDNGTVLGLEFLRELATQDFASCFRLPSVPCLLVHGKADSAVPFQQSLDAVAAAAGETVLFAYPDGEHGLQGAPERAFTHRAIHWWLERDSL